MRIAGLTVGNPELTAAEKDGIKWGWRLAPLLGTLCWFVTGYMLAIPNTYVSNHISRTSIWFIFLDLNFFAICLFFAYGSLLFAVPFVYAFKRWKIRNLAVYLLGAVLTLILTAAISVIGLVFLVFAFLEASIWAAYCGFFMWLFAEYLPRKYFTQDGL